MEGGRRLIWVAVVAAQICTSRACAQQNCALFWERKPVARMSRLRTTHGRDGRIEGPRILLRRSRAGTRLTERIVTWVGINLGRQPMPNQSSQSRTFNTGPARAGRISHSAAQSATQAPSPGASRFLPDGGRWAGRASHPWLRILRLKDAWCGKRSWPGTALDVGGPCVDAFGRTE